MSQQLASITAVYGYLPKDIISNQDLERLVDTTSEWITTRTGIQERRILRGKGLGTSDMGVEAVKGLLAKRQLKPTDIDMLICATVTPDMQFPATANIICDKLGIKNIPSFDIGAACSGFLYALTTAMQFVQNGTYQRVVVVGADKMSSIIDYEDRATCVLFGDGAGAVWIEKSTDDCGIIDTILRSDGAGCQHLHQKAGGSMNTASRHTVRDRAHYVYQEGKSVFKFAVKNMAGVAEEIMLRNQLKAADVAWLVPHQANKRIIDATARRMGIPDEKIMINIHKYGNTTAGTIPICLWEWEDKLKKGDNIILAAFGGGFTWGAVYIKWNYSNNNLI